MNDNVGTAVITETVGQEAAEQIAGQSCVLEIHKHQPGFAKKISARILFEAAEVKEEKIDPARLNVSKVLVERKEIKKLLAHSRSFFGWIKENSLPGGLLTLGNGQFLIPLSMVDTVKQRIDNYLEQRDALLDEFEARYPEVIEKSKERLGPIFDETDYPTFAQIREDFGTSYKFISNKVPEELARISQELYDAEKKRIQDECSGLVPLIQENLRTRFLDLVEHFKDRLATDDETGKKKRFHGSNIDKLRDFIATFAHMNLTGDGDLAVLVEQSRALVEGADVDKIRTDDAFRTQLEKSFEEVKVAADKLVVDRKRRVVLED